jgi:hypothetical protein
MITGVHISSSEMVISKDDTKKNSLPQFSKNQVVKAIVAGLLPQGRAQLVVNGKTIVARTAMLLTPGEEVQLKVVQQKDAIVLKLLGPFQKATSSHMASLAAIFSKEGNIPDLSGKLAPRIIELLSQIALKSGRAEDDFLPRLIEKIGVSLEKKMGMEMSKGILPKENRAAVQNWLGQDLKALILKEISSLGTSQTGRAKTISVFSEIIENVQLLNHQNTETGRFLLPFPVFSESGFRFGQLLIDTGKNDKAQRKESDRVINISFLLDMTRLGPLRADFSILKHELSGKFLLCDKHTCEYIRSLVPELKARLLQRNYHVRQVECSVARHEEIAPSILAEALAKNRENHVLNIVV